MEISRAYCGPYEVRIYDDSGVNGVPNPHKDSDLFVYYCIKGKELDGTDLCDIRLDDVVWDKPCVLHRKCRVWARRGGSSFAFPIWFHNDHGQRLITENAWGQRIDSFAECDAYAVVSKETMARLANLDDTPNKSSKSLHNYAYSVLSHSLRELNNWLEGRCYAYEFYKNEALVDFMSGIIVNDWDELLGAIASYVPVDDSGLLEAITSMEPDVIEERDDE